ncbi:LysR family transcriptional regulator [Oscillatoria sp. FACHB-1407]|uniref:LysR family transcriptional regulator n=1 Tax=Oscillatoria sp. FACHB-1407 TaxID=2692847 RepID=UPI00168494E9|nr:LysR family transcriptional regulator [Oscillatoria sp. FACHB-1407]MBD2459845.1 LysR family transcriptional regulator [Oscillatoria sp. FACHB-1407]
MAIDSSKLKISQLQAFVMVAEYGNFSSAALELGLAQSTVSHAIATLEDELGVVLLLRGRHGAILTPEGKDILQDAQQILQSLESIHKKANLAKGLQGGQVRVATVRSIATHVLPEIIAQFRLKFPMVRVVLEEFDRYVEAEQALREGQVDVGFTSLPTSPEFEARELFRDEFVALLPPNSLNDIPLTWEQLVRYPMIMNHRSYQHNKVVRDHLLKFGYELNVAYEMREDSTIISMVRQGLGATVMARLTAEPIPPELQVRSLPVPLERTIGIITLENSLLSQAVFAFLDVATEMWR